MPTKQKIATAQHAADQKREDAQGAFVKKFGLSSGSDPRQAWVSDESFTVMSILGLSTAWYSLLDPATTTLGVLRLALVSCPRNTRYIAGGQLAVFQGASEAPISESYGSSEQRGKTANWPRPGGLR